MEEKCYKHPDKVATAWREAVVFGEPDRVSLCDECILRDSKISTIYPSNKRRRYDEHGG